MLTLDHRVVVESGILATTPGTMQARDVRGASQESVVMDTAEQITNQSLIQPDSLLYTLKTIF